MGNSVKDLVNQKEHLGSPVESSWAIFLHLRQSKTKLKARVASLRKKKKSFTSRLFKLIDFRWRIKEVALLSYRKTHGEANKSRSYFIEVITWELRLFMIILKHAN